MCCKCKKWFGAGVFVLGIVFLLVDLGVVTFWSIQWWTVAFLLVGAKMFCKGCCKGTCETEAPKTKKK
jgi:uncharacterized membrane protein